MKPKLPKSGKAFDFFKRRMSVIEISIKYQCSCEQVEDAMRAWMDTRDKIRRRKHLDG